MRTSPSGRGRARRPWPSPACEAQPVGTHGPRRRSVGRRGRPGPTRSTSRPGAPRSRRARRSGCVLSSRRCGSGPDDDILLGSAHRLARCSTPRRLQTLDRDLRRHAGAGAGHRAAAASRRRRPDRTRCGSRWSHYDRLVVECPAQIRLAGRADDAAAADRLLERDQPRRRWRRTSRDLIAPRRRSSGSDGGVERRRGERYREGKVITLPLDRRPGGTEDGPGAARRPRAAWSSTTADDEREPFAAYLTDDALQAAAQAVALQRGWSTSNIRKGGLAAALRLLGVAPPAALHDRRHRGLADRGGREPGSTELARLGSPGDGARHRQRRELLPPDHADRRARLPDEAGRRRHARRDLRAARAAGRRRDAARAASSASSAPAAASG